MYILNKVHVFLLHCILFLKKNKCGNSEAGERGMW